MTKTATAMIALALLIGAAAMAIIAAWCTVKDIREGDWINATFGAVLAASFGAIPGSFVYFLMTY